MKRTIFLIVFLSFLSYSVSLSRVFNSEAAATSSSPTPKISQTPDPIPTSSFTPRVEATFTPTSQYQAINSIKPKLEAFIQVPSGTVSRPYVILSAYQSFSSESGPVSIRGTVQDKSFVCPSAPCALDFPASGQITFWAYNQNGVTSTENQANVQITAMTSGGYTLSIITLAKFVIFSDACASIWQNAESVPPSWAIFPQNPADLNTDKSLFYLASKLITSGAVNAKDCPGGGGGYNSPNACGMSTARDQMVAWQNQYDLDIWLTSRNDRIPPILLKTLIEVESQFWPTTQRLFLDEIGLGQVNQLGIDVVLRTNPDIYSHRQ